jgi:small ligand-binding sensory domain FIST
MGHTQLLAFVQITKNVVLSDKGEQSEHRLTLSARISVGKRSWSASETDFLIRRFLLVHPSTGLLRFGAALALITALRFQRLHHPAVLIQDVWVIEYGG